MVSSTLLRLLLSVFFLLIISSSVNCDSLDSILLSDKLNSGVISRKGWLDKPKNLKVDSQYWKIFHDIKFRNLLFEQVSSSNNTDFKIKNNGYCANSLPHYLTCSYSYNIVSSSRLVDHESENIKLNFYLPHPNSMDFALLELIPIFRELKYPLKSPTVIQNFKIEGYRGIGRMINREKDFGSYECQIVVYLPANSILTTSTDICASLKDPLELTKSLKLNLIINVLKDGEKELFKGKSIKNIEEKEEKNKELPTPLPRIS
jgi:hypothetical protein